MVNGVYRYDKSGARGVNGKYRYDKVEQEREWGIPIRLKEREWLMGDIDMIEWSESG